MRQLTLLCCVWSLALFAPANASELWAVVEEVRAVTVRIHWVSEVKLLAAAREVGQKPQTTALGFSVLRKNPGTGAYTCDIYMPREPTRVDDRVTNHLGHELAHCLGFSHE